MSAIISLTCSKIKVPLSLLGALILEHVSEINVIILLEFSIPENIYQKINIFICTTKLIKNILFTYGNVTHRTCCYG